MYKSINLDEALEHIKVLVDHIRCAICDRTDGKRMRYSCGHTSCEDCVAVAVDCSVCLTPQTDAREPVVDNLSTQRAENIVDLFNTFQNQFHVDVYKRHRISEQLKVEKEVFPECIQAPVKYFNKRKSYTKSRSDKENKLSQIPGEQIPYDWNINMENSSDNVKDWLEKYVRKPLSLLNPNDGRLRGNASFHNNQQNVIVQRSTRKRPHFETALSIVSKQSKISKYVTPIKKSYKTSKVADTSVYFDKASKSKVKENDESGIVMDEDDVVIINDSQSIKADKDTNAWLAVLEAEKNEHNRSILETTSNKQTMNVEQENEKLNASKTTTKVKFYKRSQLSATCIYCNGFYKENETDTDPLEQARDVSITVENECFQIIIKVTNAKNNGLKSMQSVEVQTDNISQNFENNKENEDNYNVESEKESSEVKSPIACSSFSEDLFKEDACEKSVNSATKTQNIIIEESDSDEDLNASVSLQVTADVHRSCDEIDNGILADVESLEQHSKRPRRAARGLTPTSTDSSDKENFNPNRMKKTYNCKKKPNKK